MKLSKAAVRGIATLGMELRFESQNLTSVFGPRILFQHFFSLIASEGTAVAMLSPT